MKNNLLYFYQNLIFTISYLFFKTFNEKDFIKSKIYENSVIFDVGSNVGSFIKLVSKFLKNKSLEIYSFEPNVKLINHQKKMNLNKKHKLTLNPFAVHEKLNEIEYFENSVSSQSTTRKDYKIGRIIKSYMVNCISIDLYCKKNEINKIDLLKIDTEGNDYNVLLSAKGMLNEKKIKFIKIEIENTNDFFQILNYLKDFDYKLIGVLNQTYISNELKMFDCYFELSS